MTMFRLAVAGCLASLAFFSVSPAQASFRGGRHFRAPECCENSVESSCGGQSEALHVSYPLVVEEPPAAHVEHQAIVDQPIVQQPIMQQTIEHHPVVAPPIHHGFVHPPVIHSPVPPHPIYDYMWAGPYYYGVPHYYDPSWERTTVRANVRRGPPAKGRDETYPALPYSEFAAQQAADAAKAKSAAPQVDPTRAQIVVSVPSDETRVFIEGQLMATTGRVRTFMTPPLAAGKVFEMEIRGEFPGDPPHTKRIEVRAGQVLQVELGR